MWFGSRSSLGFSRQFGLGLCRTVGLRATAATAGRAIEYVRPSAGLLCWSRLLGFAERRFAIAQILNGKERPSIAEQR